MKTANNRPRQYQETGRRWGVFLNELPKNRIEIYRREIHEPINKRDNDRRRERNVPEQRHFHHPRLAVDLRDNEGRAGRQRDEEGHHYGTENQPSL